MNSSGIKRGAAVFAVAAMAVAGVPALTSTAFADSVQHQVNVAPTGGPNAVQLYNGNVEISTKPDGTDSTVNLEAGGGRLVTDVRFEYQLFGGATWITIADAQRNADGTFTHEWANPPVGETVTLRVRNITPAGPNNSDPTTATVEVFGDDPNTRTVNLVPGANQGGYYDSDDTGCFNGINMIVSGTSSVQSTDQDDAPLLRTLDGDGLIQDTGVPSEPGQKNNAADIVAPAGTFSGYLDLQNYDFANAAGEFPDQVVVQAQTDVPGEPNETQDHEAYTLYSQEITSVTAKDENNGNGSLPTEVTVTVRDQKGEPVAGALVNQVGSFAIIPIPIILGSDLTNSRGEATFSQNLATMNYFADNDCNGEFRFSEGDRNSGPFQAGNSASTISIASTPEGARPVPSSTIETVTVTGADGNPLVNRQVRVTRSGPGSSNMVDFFQTNAQGQVLFSVTCNTTGTINVEAAFQDISGTGTPTPSDPFNRSVKDSVQCGIPPVTGPGTNGKAKINPAIKGKNIRNGNDWVLVRAKQADGAKVKIYKIVGKNRRVLIGEGNLNSKGVFKKVFRDTNGARITAYKAVVSNTSDTQRGVTNRRQIRKVG